MSAPEGRNHVVFDDNDAGPSTSSGPFIHPDRQSSQLAKPTPKGPKKKTAAKQRYLKAKLDRRKKRAAAQRVGGSKLEAKAKAGAADEETARKIAAKRAKREARRKERQAKRAKEREKAEARAAVRAATSESESRSECGSDSESGGASGSDGEEVDDAESRDVDMADGAGKDAPDPDASAGEQDAPAAGPSRSPSPPPLVPFPVAQSAPAPDAALLSRQGLPKGLEDAEFVDQNLRVGLDTVAGLSERMKLRLAEIGVADFFAAAILPQLLPLPLTPLPYATLHDHLISAPTGSGKTLAYAVPIVDVLAARVVPRLRALVVLPTRDLVVQVRETLETLAKGTGLVVGSVTGHNSFTHEQSQLVADLDTPLLGGSSRLDILVATPGRLMDHLAATTNFTLQHLRFLVIDEADRLLTQSFQNWLAQVLAHTRPPAAPPAHSGSVAGDAVAPAWAVALGAAADDWEGSEQTAGTCQKLLFSATLTRDPSKTAALALSSPRYTIVSSSGAGAGTAVELGTSFALPAGLTECMLVVPPALKPLHLVHLVHSAHRVRHALVFAKSVEAAARLVSLLGFFEDAYVGAERVVARAYTSEMTPKARKALLKDFEDGKVHILVCSDLIARGMDLPSVEHVVSYDVPLDMTKYVHRVGRTARAGRAGTAWTLVEKQEALHFKGMLKAAGHEAAVKKLKVKEDELAGYRGSYDIAMKRLKEAYTRD